MALWDVLPDSEREQWSLEPFARVGPLRFGMSPDQASAALGGLKPGVQKVSPGRVSIARYDARVTLYYSSARGLWGISVNPRQ